MDNELADTTKTNLSPPHAFGEGRLYSLVL